MSTSVPEAKTFLVTQIAAQGQRDGIPLSETEEKMLYFSETDWTLPDIWDVNTAFERDYDTAEFEDKISGLIRRFRAYAKRQQPAELTAWNEAVRVLRKGDHYLLVMVDLAALPSNAATPFLKLVLWGVGGFIILAACLMVYLSLQ